MALAADQHGTSFCSRDRTAFALGLDRRAGALLRERLARQLGF